ncbi:uncharacterized protein LOC122001564 isoform X2 [Zingiber officinale]|uniref:uncharacterized protein LOC122001564 isoform X2 n=1 Tax=Zingiber officinale TaxID=94328 RepID=UPI001C4D707E|nr:uncharacterized protein LOC122001564 isoform X2 [Zingiber officinale]
MSVTPSASSLSVFFFSFGFVLFLSSIPPNSGESLTCLSVYREGGAPAVFHSAKCPRWTLLPHSHRLPQSNCQAAVHQGRRRSQEDRVVCALGMRIPFAGRKGIEELDVGLVAIFDGHNGAEASDMASKLLLEYFILHLYFLLDGIYSSAMKRSTHKLIYEENGLSFEIVRPLQMQKWQYQYTEKSIWISTRIFDRTFHKEILKESLLRTIQDIDATFSKEALQNNFESGSTAAVVLIVNGEILAVNVGDSKILMCTEDSDRHNRRGNLSRLMRRRNEGAILPVAERRLLKLAIKSEPVYYVKELTVDHHADREDERSRIEAAGGHIVEWAGVARVNGQLAVSRAIGDIGFKKYGVVSTPEVTDWQHITMNDTYLIAASDGVFEKLTMQEVCDLLWYEKVKANAHLEYINNMPYSLADLLVNTAFERGAIDNMAAVVIPLKPNSIPRIYVENEFNVEETSGSSSLHLLKELENDASASGVISIEYSNQILSKFNRFLVETEQRKLGCFYLSENLNEHTDYVFESPKVFQNRGDHGSLIDSEVPFHSGGPLKLYNDQKLCWHFGIHDGDRGQCTSPDVFVNFLGLLDSIPYSDIRTESSESFGYKLPNFRYVLKRRFDRGSYGEVWLAFHWNCSLDNDAYKSSHKMFYHFASTIEMEESKCSSNANTNSSNKRCFSDQNDDNLFILKRIMVERGNNAYLSGLREKYFGELFLNASMSLVGTVGESQMTLYPMQSDSFGFCQNNNSCAAAMNDMFNAKPRNYRVSYEEGLNNIARYIESFESESKELWLVFKNEGLSLSKLIYTAEETKLFSTEETDGKMRNVQVLRPSSWWHWLRMTQDGQMGMKNLIRQLLLALKACHDRNITHRDIKPENMIVCFEDVDTGKCSREIPNGDNRNRLKMRIIDFGSAMDDFTMKHLYGSGPTRSEQTFEYTPPEALLNASWFQGPKSVTLKYDMWSVGVVMLELVLGSPHVFEINDRTRALLDQHLEGWSDHTKELAYKLRSYMEMCILIPGISPNHYPNGGRKDHEDRLSVDEALRHPYFQTHH